MPPVSRRAFVVSALATGATLTLGFHCEQRVRRTGASEPDELEPNLWVRIDAAGNVHIRVHKCEMGQGVLTALPMLIAEELEADWSRIKIEQADADFRFPDQNTSGSTSIIDAWTPLRLAGASVRVALVRAAARAWRVPDGECEARDGRIIHRQTGRSIGFGDLVPLMRGTPVPLGEIRLKQPGCLAADRPAHAPSRCRRQDRGAAGLRARRPGAGDAVRDRRALPGHRRHVARLPGSRGAGGSGRARRGRVGCGARVAAAPARRDHRRLDLGRARGPATARGEVA